MPQYNQISVLIVCVLFSLVLSRMLPLSKYSIQSDKVALDVLLATILGAIGLYEASRIISIVNPTWIPHGSYWEGYLGYLAEGSAPGHVDLTSGYRYYMYSWLSGVLVNLQGVAPYVAGLQISLYSLGLLPVGVYVLARQLTPASIAFSGALMVPYLPAVIDTLGTPTDYGLTTLFQLFSIAFGAAAIRTARLKAFLLTGIALSMLLGTAPKGMVIALVTIPLCIIALPWYRSPRRAVVGAFCLLFPVVGMWIIYAIKDPVRATLEAHIFVVESNRALAYGIHLTPKNYGLPLQTPLEKIGYWRIGSMDALLHLKDTVRFLIWNNRDAIPLAERLPDFLDSTANACRFDGWGLGGGRWVPPVLLACLGPRESPLWRRLILAIFLVVCIVGTYIGATRVPFTSRYFLSNIVLLPALVLAGVAAIPIVFLPRFRRDWSFPWWPLSIAIFITIISNKIPQVSPPLLERADIIQSEPLSKLIELRDRIQPGDVIVDATLWGTATSIFLDIAHIQWIDYPRSGVPDIYVSPIGGATNRYIVLNCATSDGPEFWWKLVTNSLDSSDRIEKMSTCIYRDREPDKGLHLLFPDG